MGGDFPATPQPTMERPAAGGTQRHSAAEKYNDSNNRKLIRFQ
jgi:hypothetical protein